MEDKTPPNAEAMSYFERFERYLMAESDMIFYGKRLIERLDDGTYFPARISIRTITYDPDGHIVVPEEPKEPIWDKPYPPEPILLRGTR